MSLSPSQILDIMGNSEWWLRARLATPELATVRVVAAELLPPEYHGPCLRGWTAAGLDLVLGGDEHDRHPTIIISADSITEGDGDAIDGTFSLHALLLHEAAHIVADRPLYDAPVDPMHVEFFRIAITQQVQTTPGISLSDTRRVLFQDHGLRFLRCVCHLHHRARFFVPDIDEVIYGRGISPASQYQAALGSEPEDMRNTPFSEILSKPCPKPFWQLWQHDTTPWLDKGLSEQQFERLLCELREAATMAPSK